MTFRVDDETKEVIVTCSELEKPKAELEIKSIEIINYALHNGYRLVFNIK